ncbi:DotU family type IV/VI secretion system protein [Bacterioplanoides sp.]|uniref:DotU family type IV/VI secretion system protein n=1 Tax=Bacterioplanoides sp. TaxID=2066072 RepID=UPI003B00A699
MRLLDHYLESLLAARNLTNALSTDGSLTSEELKKKFRSWIDRALATIAASGTDEQVRMKSLFPVVAYIDELILTSEWKDRHSWKNDSLQRHYFDTTNAGSEFYDRLNLLNRQGSDSEIREIYLMCIGLGFKGKYFMPEDRPRIEEARGYNLSLLFPEDSLANLDETILFSHAYQKDMRENKLMKSRKNLLPVFSVFPFVAVAGAFLFYAVQINGWVSDIIKLVN